METCPFCGGKSDDCIYCAAEKRKDDARQTREEERRQLETPPPPPSPMASFSRPLNEQAPPPAPAKRGMGVVAVVGLTVLGYLFFSVLALVILPIDAALAVLCIAYLVVPPAVGLAALLKKARRLRDIVKVLLSFLLGAVMLFGILMAVVGPGGR